MCRALEVSRSGFYEWLSRDGKSLSVGKRKAFDDSVAEAFHARKGRSGSPELTLDLRDAGIHVNRKTVAKSMQNQGLRAKASKRYKATTCSNHGLPVAPNLLDQSFSATGPNEKWAGDITYLWTDEGWLYLAVLIDLYSRMIVGWAMSERMTAGLVKDALVMALWRRQMPKNIIVHSTGESILFSQEYQALLTQHQLRCSMSRKGNCCDNACAESFFTT